MKEISFNIGVKKICPLSLILLVFVYKIESFLEEARGVRMDMIKLVMVHLLYVECIVLLARNTSSCKKKLQILKYFCSNF